MARHFLFAMWEGGGNVPPLLGVAARLIARGHRVTVLGDPTIEDEAQRTGCGFEPWRRAPHRTTLRPEDDLLRDWETKNPFTQLSNYRDKLITEPAPRYAKDTLDALDRTSADVLVSEYTIFGAFMAAEKRGLPAVGLVPNIWPMPVVGAPPFGPGFLPARSILGRLRDTFFRWLVGSIFDKAVPRLNETRRELGLPPVRTFFEQALKIEALLVLTSEAFDFSSRFVPGNVRYVGPILDDPLWVEPWTPPWPADNRDPLVVVGFSTTFQDQGRVLRNVVEALASLRVRALVTLGEMLPAHEVQSTGAVVVVRSAPHREVLPHAALLITHCGHGTTLKALATGVPMLCLPWVAIKTTRPRAWCTRAPAFGSSPSRPPPRSPAASSGCSATHPFARVRSGYVLRSPRSNDARTWARSSKRRRSFALTRAQEVRNDDDLPRRPRRSNHHPRAW